MMRKALLIIVIATLFLGSLPTFAQTSTPTPSPTPSPTATPSVDWCYTFDFSVNDGGWAVTSGFVGSYSSGAWRTAYSAPNDNNQLTLYYNLASPADIKTISVTYSVDITTGWAFREFGMTNVRPPLADDYVPVFLPVSVTTVQAHTVNAPTPWGSVDKLGLALHRSDTGSTYHGRVFSIYLEGVGINPFPSNSCAWSTPTPTPTPTPINLVQPFAPNDFYLHPIGNEDTHIFTNQVAQSVVVPEPVYIRGVSEITLSECIDFIHGIDTISCTLFDESLAPDYAVMQGLLDQANQDIYRIEMEGQDTGYFYNYLVKNPTVGLGDTVDDCTIGSTIFGDGGFSSIEFTPILATDGMFSFLDLSSEYSIEPTGTKLPCDTPPAYTECVNTAVLNAQTSQNWASSNAVWDSESVILANNGYVEIDLNLDLSTDNIVFVYGQGANATIKIIPLNNLSDAVATNVTFNASNPLERTATLPATSGSDIVRVRVTNVSSTPLQLFSLCVKTELDEINPDEEVEACIFQDREFQTNLFWTVTDGIYKEGQYRLNTGGELEQNISLEADNYYITIITSLVHKSGYNLDVTETTDGITWEFNDGTGWETIDFISESEYAKENNRFVSSVLFNVASPITLDFAIRATFTGLGTEFAATVLSACLSTTEYDDSGVFLFPQKCGITFAPPSGENISAWTSWLWANLWEFYECQLMKLLNNMYKLMIQMFETWGWTVRYSQYALKLFYTWLGTDLFPWLNGQFYNIATGRTTVVGSGGCDNVFCFLESLINGVLSPIIALVQSLIDLIGGVLTFLLDVAGGFIGLLFSFLDFIISGLNQAWAFFSEFIGAWNNTPAADLPYIPSCSINPQSNGMCVALWMLENTIFSGRGAIFIPLLTSWGYILLLLWGAKKLKKAVLEAGALL